MPYRLNAQGKLEYYTEGVDTSQLPRPSETSVPRQGFTPTRRPREFSQQQRQDAEVQRLRAEQSKQMGIQAGGKEILAGQGFRAASDFVNRKEKTTEVFKPAETDWSKKGGVLATVDPSVLRAAQTIWDSARFTLNDGVERVDEFVQSVGDQKATPSQRVGKFFRAATGVANLAILPAAAPFAGSEDLATSSSLPLRTLGQGATFFTKGIEQIHNGASFVLTKGVDVLPIPNDTKENIREPFAELGAFIATAGALKAAHVGTKKASEFMQRKIGQAKSISTRLTNERLAQTGEVTPGDAKVIVNEVMKKVPVQSKGSVVVNTEAGKVRVVSNQKLVLQNFLKGREDITYKTVRSLGKDAEGRQAQARFEWDYKKQRATIFVTKKTTAANIAHELGHYFDNKLSLKIAESFTDLISEYGKNKVQVKNALTKYAVESIDGTVTPRKISALVNGLVENLQKEIRVLAKSGGEQRKTLNEQFASAVREVLLKPQESLAIAPEFSRFVQYFQKGKKGILPDLVKKTIEKSGATKKTAISNVSVQRISSQAKNSLQNRKVGEKPNAVTRAIKEIRSGKKPPIKTRTLEDGTLFIEDGRHHLEAARKLKLKNYPVEDVTNLYKAKTASVAPKTTSKAPTTTQKAKTAPEGKKGVKTGVTEGQFASTGLKTGKTVEGRKAFRTDKINAPEDVQQLVAGIAKEKGEFRSQRISKSNDDIRALAQEVGVTADDLMNLRPGSIANTETIFKARQLVADATKDFRTFLKTVQSDTLTQGQAKIFKEKLMRLQGIMNSVAGFRTEASNIFRQFNMEVMPGEFDVLQGLISKVKNIDAKAGESLASFSSAMRKSVNTEVLNTMVVKKRGGKPLTEEEVRTINEKAKRVQSLEEQTGGLTDILNKKQETLEYLKSVSDLQQYLQTLAPAHNLRLLTEIVGRGTMLFSIKSPLLNIESNTVQGILQALERRISTGKTSGVLTKEVSDYVRYVTDVYNKTGMDLSRMLDAAEARSGIKRVLGETRTSTAGGGPVRAVGRFYERWVFRRSLGLPDVISSAFHAADSVNISASLIAKSEGLSGKAMRIRAKEVFDDAMSLTAKSEEGAILRKQAVADAEYSTWQNKSRASETSLAIRGAINKATGDLRLGDLNIPFAKTPANVISAGLESAGGGLFSGLFQMKKAMFDKTLDAAAKKSAIRGATRSFVRAGIGLTAGTIIASMLDPDDFIGIYPLDAKERKLLQLQGGGENMIRIGGKWISLEYFGPIGVPIAGIMYARKYGGNVPDNVFRYVQGTATQILRLPGVNEARELVEGIRNSLSLGMTTGEIATEAKNNFLGFIRSRTVPGIVNDIANATDLFMRETAGETTAQFQAGIPGVRQGLPVRVNILGEEQRTTGIGQIFFGARMKPVQTDATKQFIASNRISISTPSKNTKIYPKEARRDGRIMTQEEYYHYVKISGRAIKERLDRMLPRLQKLPSEMRQEEVDAIVQNARKEAKQKVELHKF